MEKWERELEETLKKCRVGEIEEAEERWDREIEKFSKILEMGFQEIANITGISVEKLKRQCQEDWEKFCSL